MGLARPRRRLNGTRLLGTLIVVALVAALLVLLSERHHRLYGVELQDGALRVVRGRMLPAGFAPYAPGDPFLSRVYAPLPCPSELTAELRDETFAERDDLDRALFRAMQGWIDQHLASQDPRRLAEAVALVERAGLLPGIEAAQRAQLQLIRGRVAWLQGRVRLDDAAAALRDATSQLLTASQSGERHAHQAGELYERIAPLSDQLSRALRQPLLPADRADAPVSANALNPELPAAAVPPPAPAAVPPAPTAATASPPATASPAPSSPSPSAAAAAPAPSSAASAPQPAGAPVEPARPGDEP